MKKYEEIKRDIIRHSITSLRILRGIVDFGIGFLEREIDDTGKASTSKSKKNEGKKFHKIDIE